MFTAAEVQYIERLLAPSVVSGELPGMPEKELCLKVGSALVDVADRDVTTVDLVLTERELWVLRERADGATSYGNDRRFGLLLKAKIYKLLMEVAWVDEPTAAGVELTREKLHAKIESWKDTHESTDKGTHKSTDKRTSKKGGARKKAEPGEDLPGPDQAGE